MFPRRKRPPHHPLVEHGNRSNIVFVTVCVRGRRPLLNRNEVVSLILELWKTHDAWLVGRYVFMPDHVHFFCAPGKMDHPPLGNWIRFWKSAASRSWPHPEETPVWLRSFWDRQIRTGDSYTAKWAYVRLNPVRAQLVENARDWPFHGELHRLVWHD